MQQPGGGVVHRVILTTGHDEGYVIVGTGAYNLHTWAPVRLEHVRVLGAGTGNHPAQPITIRITTVSLREPRVGDKFASRHAGCCPKRAKLTFGFSVKFSDFSDTSLRTTACRHGQKGTIGCLIDHADMPYTIDGIVPDILFNSHGVPSQMGLGSHLDTHLLCFLCFGGSLA